MGAMENVAIVGPSEWTDYELIDTGDGMKLERFGTYTIIRPDPRILWKKSAPDIWSNACAEFIRSTDKDGSWNIVKPPPDPWRISYENLVFTLRPTEFKHTGIFPEQAVNWDFLKKTLTGKHTSVLNLFGYTGGATLAAASSGAKVTHVDSVKSTIDWASENARASGLSGKPIRWIHEDAIKFVQREIRRGNSYDCIIMDPPRFGRGTQGEVWKLEKDLPSLLAMCRQLLSKTPECIIINAYTADLSSLALINACESYMFPDFGKRDFGELTLIESAGKRNLPCGIVARWSNV